MKAGVESNGMLPFLFSWATISCSHGCKQALTLLRSVCHVQAVLAAQKWSCRQIVETKAQSRLEANFDPCTLCLVTPLGANLPLHTV